ncbi:5-formyltetrahydrofolate cyclo-ligase [Thalassospira xiamenensis]|uniref:5-formyltetrahydrofolate cyclo-ligase n=1 Tax=Thalassospira xiamenensis TaxID=220697 RepID=UPI001FFFC46F|nr:5-formyltetrahydrofolate cyclo-ligase [Thalassospira xiamenensis]MCK2167221.1 hypothetical protein [Thalassospira xiamenensis]
MADNEHQFASPPCFMHEIDPAYFGTVHVQTQQEIDVARWRNAERERLIGLCKSLPRQHQREASRSICLSINLVIGEIQKGPVGFFWPIDGQVNLISLMEEMSLESLEVALPRKRPNQAEVCFYRWNIGDSLFVGEEGAPVYCEGDQVFPQIVLVPITAFDNDRFFLEGKEKVYNKYLRNIDQKPYVIGVGYNFQNIKTIYPQYDDIQLDLVVTESGPVAWE